MSSCSSAKFEITYKLMFKFVIVISRGGEGGGSGEPGGHVRRSDPLPEREFCCFILRTSWRLKRLRTCMQTVNYVSNNKVVFLNLTTNRKHSKINSSSKE